ncbi:MAG: hypothetical protein ACR2QW_12865 [bacterium]
MVTRQFRVLLVLLFLSAMIPCKADHHGSVRIYKLNKKDQLIKSRWVKHSDKPGCHDLRGTKKAHRVAQVGYAWCTIYSGDSCEPGTELSAMWRGKKYRTADIDVTKPQVRLLQGSDWFLDQSSNIKIGSWACEY